LFALDKADTRCRAFVYCWLLVWRAALHSRDPSENSSSRNSGGVVVLRTKQTKIFSRAAQ